MTVSAPNDTDDVRARLRDVLAEVHDGAPSGPVDWPRIDRRLVAVRRRRTAVRTGAGLAVAAGLLAAVQVGPLPYPHWAPAVAVHAAAFPDGPVLGTLGNDTGWLESLRRSITVTVDEPGDEHWTLVPGGVRVIFAGDVGSYRMALVEETRRWGAIEDTSTRWLVGARGAGADALVEDGGGSAQVAGRAVSVGVVWPDVLPPAARPAEGGAVLVAIGFDRAEVRDVADGGAGTAPPRTVTAGPDGVLTVTVAAGQVPVEVSFPQFPDLASLTPVDSATGRIGLYPDLPLTADTLPAGLLTPAVHGAVPPTDRRDDLVAAAGQLLIGRPAGSVASWRTLWLAPAPDPTGDRPTGVVALTTRGGAHRVVVTRTEWSGVTAGLPAGPLEQAGLAVRWPSTQELTSGTAAVHRVVLLGPAGAVRAVLQGPAAGGPAGRTVDLVDGYALADAPGATSVTFVDAAGSTLARVPVADWSR